MERRSGGSLRRAVDHRPPYARDRARVIHCAAFRRLQAKTQVLGIGEGDFHRTRLTHSMEVAQVARGIVLELKHKSVPSEGTDWLPGLNLIETVALAHDIGHPPFGHGGEVALNCAMSGAGGFEGNGQTLRLLSRLEAHTDGYGLDLTRRSLLGVLKYPVPYEQVVRRKLPPLPGRPTQLKAEEWKPPKCYLSTEREVVEWVLAPFSKANRDWLRTLEKAPSAGNHGKSAHHSLDTSVMELADDIAYGVHDFEDGISLKLLRRGDWDVAAKSVPSRWATRRLGASTKAIGDALFGDSSHARKRAIGAIVNALITSVQVVASGAPTLHPLLRMQAEMDEVPRALLDGLQEAVRTRVIRTPQVQTLEYRGQILVMQLFEAIASDPQRFLTEHFVREYELAETTSDALRVTADFIAGMTDEYATRMYERLFVPRRGSSSDRL